MRRWVAACGLVLLVAAAPVGGWAQERVGVVVGREIASAVPQLRRVISLQLEGVSVDEALRIVAKRAELPLTYNDAILPGDRKIWLSMEEIRTDRALEAILRDSGLKLVALTSGQVVVVKDTGQGAQAQRGRRAATVSGRVSAKETGAPIRGADVVLSLADSTLRIVTGDSGTYTFPNVPMGTHTIAVRVIGYHPSTKKVVVDSLPVTVDFVLEVRAVALDELVTTATGQQRRRDLGNAITTIHADSVLQHAPIRDLTDLLENRVPGLTMQHTTGAPGDPSRTRLRGIGSVMRSNDPVVIVDGVRLYSAQSEARSGNLTNLGCTTVRATTSGTRCSPSNHETEVPGVAGDLPAPSPLDQIDPNTIETIEVFKGPSAATMYGADAANGVIVITTKKGRPGPTRWNASIIHGRTDTPGRWPEGYFRLGRSPQRGGAPGFCHIGDSLCVVDSLVRFQALNEPDLTILGQGRRTALSLTASGGNQALTYSVTGSYSDETGLLQLPAFEVERFRATFNREAPDWMRRPHQYDQWSMRSNVTARLNATMDVTLYSSISRSEQQRSTLERRISMLAGSYLDRTTGLYIRPRINNTSLLVTGSWVPTILEDYYTRMTASTLTVTTGLSTQWRPRTWVNISGQAGVNIIPREDERFIPFGLPTPTDSGVLIRAAGRALGSSFSLQGTVRRPLRWGFAFETSVGANLTTTATADVVTSAAGLVPGTSTIAGARHSMATESRVNTSVFGWYIEPRITGQRLSISTGIRLDGGSAYGARVTRTGTSGSLLGLPKLNGSWVISEEPWFPFNTLFSSLRLRAAYGQAQVQPSAYDRLRTYVGRLDDRLRLDRLGNTELRPERSVELEGGIDADMFDSRVSIELTGYRKTQEDALMSVGLPISVNGGGFIIQNIGNIRNQGVELKLVATPVQTPALVWSTELLYARNSNTLVKLGTGVQPSKELGLVEGYPVAGRWAKPILGYADQNGNGIIEGGEVQVGDSLLFMGRLLPDYTAGLSTNVQLFGGAVGITAGFSYDAGATQVDKTASTNWVLARAWSDPSTPFSEQAAVVASTFLGSVGSARTEYGVMQDVSTFRFNLLSVNYRAPAPAARLLRAQRLTVAVQGANLGLHTTYRGKDPNVNSWSAGEGITDNGELPRPRTWQLAFSLQY